MRFHIWCALAQTGGIARMTKLLTVDPMVGTISSLHCNSKVRLSPVRWSVSLSVEPTSCVSPSKTGDLELWHLNFEMALLSAIVHFRWLVVPSETVQWEQSVAWRHLSSIAHYFGSDSKFSLPLPLSDYFLIPLPSFIAKCLLLLPS